jgi:hypothetical protein
MINNKIYFLENAAMIQNNLYQHFPKCFPNSFPTGTSCNTMRDPSWNEEIGPIPQNPHGTADIILVIKTNMKNIFLSPMKKCLFCHVSFCL